MINRVQGLIAKICCEICIVTLNCTVIHKTYMYSGETNHSEECSGIIKYVSLQTGRIFLPVIQLRLRIEPKIYKNLNKYQKSLYQVQGLSKMSLLA